MAMGREEQLAAVAELRERLARLLGQTDIPALYECYKLADMNLHWARWLLGEVGEVLPELELAARGQAGSPASAEPVGLDSRQS